MCDFKRHISDELLDRQMEQFFHVTTDAILFLDRDYNFTFLNRHASEILAPAGTDLVGRNMYELFPPHLIKGLLSLRPIAIQWSAAFLPTSKLSMVRRLIGGSAFRATR
ncbi:MAG TPA: PAS domain-containing protein [Edaphobacter sp.]|nr:PAS domain-containing protein [Edaphobacter sp.]